MVFPSTTVVFASKSTLHFIYQHSHSKKKNISLVVLWILLNHISTSSSGLYFSILNLWLQLSTGQSPSSPFLGQFIRIVRLLGKGLYRQFSEGRNYLCSKLESSKLLLTERFLVMARVLTFRGNGMCVQSWYLEGISKVICLLIPLPNFLRETDVCCFLWSSEKMVKILFFYSILFFPLGNYFQQQTVFSGYVVFKLGNS